MVTEMSDIIQSSIDVCMPLKTFKVREQHKFGLSEGTIKLMEKETQPETK